MKKTELRVAGNTLRYLSFTSFFTRNIKYKIIAILSALAFFIYIEMQSLNEKMITVPVRLKGVPKH
jgi:hypothetical protein